MYIEINVHFTMYMYVLHRLQFTFLVLKHGK